VVDDRAELGRLELLRHGLERGNIGRDTTLALFAVALGARELDEDVCAGRYVRVERRRRGAHRPGGLLVRVVPDDPPDEAGDEHQPQDEQDDRCLCGVCGDG